MPFIVALIVGHISVTFVPTIWFVSLYPVWLIATTYIFLDYIWRLLGVRNGHLKSSVGGIVVGAALAYLGMVIYELDRNPWQTVIGGMFGCIGGLLLVQAESHDLR